MIDPTIHSMGDRAAGHCTRPEIAGPALRYRHRRPPHPGTQATRHATAEIFIVTAFREPHDQTDRDVCYAPVNSTDQRNTF
jgi:hypothetical protein